MPCRISSPTPFRAGAALGGSWYVVLGMIAARIRLCIALASLGVLAVSTSRLPSQSPASQWYKGNLHTHTINSDGDSSPDAVARWYKEHRYHFLALTDHNYFTDPQGLNAFFAARDRFLLITGEEVTSGFEGAPIHVNAFRLESTIAPASGRTVLDTLQANVDRIRGAGAVPSLNHPSFRWAIAPDVFRQVGNLKLFEVFNGIRDTNDEWDLEAMWDVALSAGREIYGIAVDDAHEFKLFGPERSNPGRGWVQVRATGLSEESLLSAIERGEFYASTGVKLDSLERTEDGIDLRIAPQGDERYLVRFVGKGGRVLNESTGLEARYSLKRGDGYVRASIRDSAGRRAWVQPVFEN